MTAPKGETERELDADEAIGDLARALAVSAASLPPRARNSLLVAARRNLERRFEREGFDPDRAVALAAVIVGLADFEARSVHDDHDVHVAAGGGAPLSAVHAGSARLH